MRTLVTLLLVAAAASRLSGEDLAADLAAIRSLVAAQHAPRQSAAPAKMSDNLRRMSASADRICEEAIAAYERHPADPQRWEAALIALKTMRTFIIEIKPGYDEALAARDIGKSQSLLTRDETARAAWDEKMDGLQAALLAADDVAPTVRAEAYANAVYRASLRRGATPTQRWAVMRPLLEDMARRVTDGALLARAFEIASRTAEAADPAGYGEWLHRYAQSPLPELSHWAAGKANLQAAKVQAVEMKFTAIDGREVDLAQFRGKVVLIDFWATWCGPCKEELPNVLEAYRKYHAQGFEVVGVSLDSEKDRQKLIAYCREQGLPWPQHFDGMGWKNEFAVRYSIKAIPAMFLLGQDGKVAAVDARGPKLEREIRRLLSL